MAEIIGIGIDLCSILRIEKMISRFGENFFQKVFTEQECAYVKRFSERSQAGKYAKRWAAKEACAKALGTGMSQGVSFKNIEVFVKETGQPEIILHGQAQKRLNIILPHGKRGKILVSLTDDPPFAFAEVVIQSI